MYFQAARKYGHIVSNGKANNQIALDIACPIMHKVINTPLVVDNVRFGDLTKCLLKIELLIIPMCYLFWLIFFRLLFFKIIWTCSFEMLPPPERLLLKSFRIVLHRGLGDFVQQKLLLSPFSQIQLCHVRCFEMVMPDLKDLWTLVWTWNKIRIGDSNRIFIDGISDDIPESENPSHIDAVVDGETRFD